MSGEGDGEGDWSDSLFKPEKGDSLGDGSWGRKSNEPDLAPVAWDKLPEVSKKKPRARLATPAPGSQKESGLLDIKTLAPDLAKSMKADAGSAMPKQPTPAPAQGTARLATAAKGSTGSGLIDVQELVKVQQEEQKSTDKDRELDIIASNAAASMSGASLSGSSLSTSLVDQPAIPLEDSSPSMAEDVAPTGRGPLLAVLGILAVAVIGLAAYVLTQ